MPGSAASQVLFAARSLEAHVVGRLESIKYKEPWVRLQDGSSLVQV